MPLPAAAVLAALVLGGFALAGGKKSTPPLDPGMPPDLDARIKNALATVTDPNVLEQLATSVEASGYVNAGRALRLRAAQLRGQVSIPGVPTTPGTPPGLPPPGDVPPPLEPPRPPPIYIPPGGNIPGTSWPIPPPGTPTVPLPPPPGSFPIPPLGPLPPIPPSTPTTTPIEDLDKNIPPALAQAVAILLAKEPWTDADLQTADAMAITLGQQGFPIAASKLAAKALAVRAARAGAVIIDDVGKILTTPGNKLPPLPPTIPTTPPIITVPPTMPPVIVPPGAPPPTPTGPLSKTYKVLTGDTPSSIAAKFTGNAQNFRELAAANPDKSGRILNGQILAGEMLTLPDKWPAAPPYATPTPANVPAPSPLPGTHMTLRQGSTGPDVVLWQKIIGVTADGQFGPNTAAATIAWQKAHGLSADGVVGPQTWAAAQGTAPPPPVVSIPIPIPGSPPITIPVSLPIPTAPPVPAGHLTIQQGSSGPDVVMWQKIIGVTADGQFGPNTAAATKTWQAARGLVADGIVGPATWSKALAQVTSSLPLPIVPPPLFPVPAAAAIPAAAAPPPLIPIQTTAPAAPLPIPIAPAAPPPATMPPPLTPTPTPIVAKPTIQQGSTGPDVVTWQKIIGVAADGKFGPGTKTATIAWQQKKGLVADGIVGPKSWAAAIPMAAAGGLSPYTRYKVRRSDTPFSIAKKFTGDPNRMYELAEANPHAKQAIENGILFQGAVLNLPPTWLIAHPSTQAASAIAGVLEIIGGANAARSRRHHWGA